MSVSVCVCVCVCCVCVCVRSYQLFCVVHLCLVPPRVMGVMPSTRRTFQNVDDIMISWTVSVRECLTNVYNMYIAF